MNKEVDTYIQKNYYTLLNIANSMTKQDQFAQELLHECILQIYNKGSVNLKSYDDNSIKYFIVAIMRVNYFSKTSPFHYRIRRERQIMNIDITKCYDIESEQHNYETEEIYQLLELNYSELNWFHKSLLDLYLSLNSSMKAVSRKTTIPNQSVSRYIKEIRNIVKSNIMKQLNK